MTKHIFLKFHEKNEDYPNVASTMAAHENVARLGNGDFVWGQFTTRKNQSGISSQAKVEILEQLDNEELTYVYFYSRVGEVLYRAELVGVYNNDESRIYEHSFQELVPRYYRHLCTQIQITEQNPSIIYAYFHVRNLELLAEGKASVEIVADYIHHFERCVPILEIKGMQALLYVRDVGVGDSVRNLEIEKIEKKIKKKKVSLVPVDRLIEDSEFYNVGGRSDTSRVAQKINHHESNKKKHFNGLLAERIVVEYEKENLIRNGKVELADKVEHVSVDKGDGEGYDILSYNINGTLKYIEVKGTVNKKNTPFFITSSEVRASKEHGEGYYIYRVFDIESDNPCICVYQGDVYKHFDLQEYTFVAREK